MILEKGSRGSAVQAVQEILNFLHFEGRKSASADYESLETDGVFGADTEEAILSFQADNQLYEDGRIGPVTLAALQQAYETRHFPERNRGRCGEAFLDLGDRQIGADEVAKASPDGYQIEVLQRGGRFL